MTTTTQYTIDAFVRDAERILAAANGDRDKVVAELQPLVERVLWDDGLFDERYRADRPNGRPRYLYHSAEDGSLQVYVVEFELGKPTPVHDHDTWGLIGIAGGQQRTERYIRTDDRSNPEWAKLELVSDEVLTRGAVYPLLPPDDIHLIETVGEGSSYSFHVLGADFGKQTRNIYDVETGAITAVTGHPM